MSHCSPVAQIKGITKLIWPAKSHNQLTFFGLGHMWMVSLQHWGMVSGGKGGFGEGQLLFMLGFQGL